MDELASTTQRQTAKMQNPLAASASRRHCEHIVGLYTSDNVTKKVPDELEQFIFNLLNQLQSHNFEEFWNSLMLHEINVSYAHFMV